MTPPVSLLDLEAVPLADGRCRPLASGQRRPAGELGVATSTPSRCEPHAVAASAAKPMRDHRLTDMLQLTAHTRAEMHRCVVLPAPHNETETFVSQATETLVSLGIEVQKILTTKALVSMGIERQSTAVGKTATH